MSTEAGDPITAHGGGGLVDLKAPAAERSAVVRHAEGLKTVRLSARDLADLEMLASGAFSPLKVSWVRRITCARETRCVWPRACHGRFRSRSEWRRPRRARSSRARRSRWLAATADRLATMKLAEVYQRRSRARGRGGLRHRRPGASGSGQRARDAAVVPGRKRDAAKRDSRADLPGIPARAAPDAGRVRRARMAQNCRLSDAQPDPSRSRIYSEGGARDLRRPAAPSAGRRDQGRRRPGRGADGNLQGAAGPVLPARPCDARR